MLNIAIHGQEKQGQVLLAVQLVTAAAMKPNFEELQKNLTKFSDMTKFNVAQRAIF